MFAAQFSLTNDTDCEAANLALRYYKAAQDMMPGGAERSSVVREGTEFSARRKKACEPKDPKEPK